MILVSESGSTKTDWRLISKDGHVQFNTIGFNPYHISTEMVVEALLNSGMERVKEKVKEVYFYGAGCSTSENKEAIRVPLKKYFSSAKVEVDHDLLAAARATCGTEKGMVGILGTGSNSCLFDGKEIVHNVRALGYVLGDYGGGAHIGKSFIKSYLEGEFNDTIVSSFKKKYNLTASQILDAVYKQPLPNRFLAQFSEFVAENMQEPELKEMVVKCFHDFFKTNVCKYPNYSELRLHLVGSIAKIYRKEIESVAQEYGVTIGKLVKQPIDQLVDFHS
jgi:N-acetylglucosamine kinase-like BadF-type ATPase